MESRPSFEEFAAGNTPDVSTDFRPFNTNLKSEGKLEVAVHYHVPKGSGLQRVIDAKLEQLFSAKHREWMDQYPTEGTDDARTEWREVVRHTIWSMLHDLPGLIHVTHIGVCNLAQLRTRPAPVLRETNTEEAWATV